MRVFCFLFTCILRSKNLHTIGIRYYIDADSMGVFNMMGRVVTTKGLALALVVVMLLVAVGPALQEAHSFGNTTLKVGSRGDDVYELQGRLKFLGYYTGAVDGKFGWQTYWAVRNFQWKFGMTVDGIVGPQTKSRLVRATKAWTGGADKGNVRNEAATPPVNLRAASHGYSEAEIRMMAHAVFGEARGEPYEGQVAVVGVILNRIKSELFPNSVASVIYQPGAFTAVADGQINLTPNETSYKAVRDALNGWDPSGGALYYFNPSTATSKWIWSRPQIKQIGRHIFCM